MSTHFARIVSVTLGLALLVAIETACAGPPRSPYGGISKPTYAGSQERRRQRQASDYRTRSLRYGAPMQSRCGFSYQPVPDVSIKAGDRVTIASAGVKLMRGRDEIATLSKGQEVKVQKVQGRWLGTSIEVDEVEKSGWVLSSDVVPVAQTPMPNIEAVGADSGEQPPEASCRGFSYQATPRLYTARSCPSQRTTGRSHSYRGTTTLGSDDYGSRLPFAWGSRSY
jgi:hypothetical protein